MDRITGKQVQSMMEALNQVYVQPEVEQLDEELNFLREFDTEEGSNIPSAAERQRRAKEKERARIERDRLIQQAGGGAAGEAERRAGKEAQLNKEIPPGTYMSNYQRSARTDAALNRDARYRTRQTGEANLRRLGGGDLDKGLEIFRKQQAERAAANAKDQKTDPPARTNPPAGNNPPASQTVAASGGAGGRVTVGRKYAATLGGKQGTVTYDASGKRTFTANAPTPSPTPSPSPAPTTPAGSAVADKTPAPAARPVPTGTTASGQKFERRLPTMAELRAAQAARAAAKASGGDRAAQEKAAVAGGVQQAQRQASVDASIKKANRPEVLNRQAPAGSALRAQQDRLAAQKKAQSAAKPAPASTSAAPRPTATPAPRPTAGAPAVQKKRQPIAASADLFDIVKGELLDEGYSEEDAMYIMANLNEEQTEIVMNEGIGALLKGAVRVGKKLLTKSAKKGGKSAIAKRAGNVVKDQRAGVMGTDDALNKAQQSLDKSMSRLRRQERRGGRGAAALNARSVERDVRKANAMTPARTSSKPFAQRIDPPKETGSKPGVIKLEKSNVSRPPSYKEVMAKYRKEFASKSEAEKQKIFRDYITRWEQRNK